MLIYMKGNLMTDVTNTKIEPKERQCKICGRILPIDQFSIAYGKIVCGHAKNAWAKKSLKEEEENSGTKSVKVEWMIP
ncbi:hypothetical protein G4451_12850 [Fusicatenibacter saccharivorans]|uniref:hypothetical protein n=1 Tax=Fusicatenibacter saccharivorans TaxID=1150298 RepID=UPI001570BAB8|nr:hypothetical protein [Fusicatenibacter saccharivorans]NSE27443.1 hypothetical protein [Fusicatenibacter saccharivorans]